MKQQFADAFLKIASKDKTSVFLTGDVGYNMLEKVQSTLGPRFINAGIAEANMMSVAAGMSHVGLKPWVYSIGTFVTLKTVEQLRNDICHPNLPVKLVGNGGGYGYGVIGLSHHLLEEIAIFKSFPEMHLYLPAFLEDIESVVNKMHEESNPSYIRLNGVKQPDKYKGKYSPVRHINNGSRVTVVVFGHLVHNAIAAIKLAKAEKAVDLWVVTEYPYVLNKALITSISGTKSLITIEEHVKTGGLGEDLAARLATKNIKVAAHIYIYAAGYVSGNYGNQEFHWRENSMDIDSLKKLFKKY